MARKYVLAGVLCLVGVVAGGVLDVRGEDTKGKEPEKKPNIVKDYVCLRDGELCHPEYSRNRGLYVSCSNGVAWEQTCPRCSYHPINCPQKSLWFDGEKCDWASPKLASMPCLDRFPALEALNSNSVKESEEAAVQVAKDQRPQNPMHYAPKAPKSGEEEEVAKVVAVAPEAPEVVPEVPAEEESLNKIERKSSEDADADFPTYLNADDNLIGSKIVRLSDPVYTLVNNPDGSGKQVLMRVSQPFVLEDPARSVLPNLNVISSFSYRK